MAGKKPATAVRGGLLSTRKNSCVCLLRSQIPSESKDKHMEITNDY
jgi:hypothetical protein